MQCHKIENMPFNASGKIINCDDTRFEEWFYRNDGCVGSRTFSLLTTPGKCQRVVLLGKQEYVLYEYNTAQTTTSNDEEPVYGSIFYDEIA